MLTFSYYIFSSTLYGGLHLIPFKLTTCPPIHPMLASRYSYNPIKYTYSTWPLKKLICVFEGLCLSRSSFLSLHLQPPICFLWSFMSLTVFPSHTQSCVQSHTRPQGTLPLLFSILFPFLSTLHRLRGAFSPVVSCQSLLKNLSLWFISCGLVCSHA